MEDMVVAYCLEFSSNSWRAASENGSTALGHRPPARVTRRFLPTDWVTDSWAIENYDGAYEHDFPSFQGPRRSRVEFIDVRCR
jgi:hypothetical protein